MTLVHRYIQADGSHHVDYITDPDRIERYLGLVGEKYADQLATGAVVVIDKDEWQLTN